MTHQKKGEPRFKLVASRRGCIQRANGLEVDAGRLADLPERPKGFTEVTGTYEHVAAAAVKANTAQERSSYLDYLYSPELADEKELAHGAV
jgi:hypothetical protein